MALSINHEEVPGTEYLVDVDHELETRHARGGKSDVNLIPQPTSSPRDPLTWSQYKKYYQLFLLALYACAFSMGENTLGAAWATVSEDTGVSITNMNAGSALNYLLLGFGNIFWIPMAMKLGRKSVFLATTCFCLGAAVWLGNFYGLAQWMLSMILNGVGTSAYQAVIQLSVFDMFYVSRTSLARLGGLRLTRSLQVHERGRALSCYLFGQQLGSIIGLICGGKIADTLGWRWSQFIVAIIEAGVLVLLFFTFEETVFPRFLVADRQSDAVGTASSPADYSSPSITGDDKKAPRHNVEQDLTATVSTDFGEAYPCLPKRTLLERLQPWSRCPEDRTTYWEYFKRPMFLFAFPNIVIVSIGHLSIPRFAGC